MYIGSNIMKYRKASGVTQNVLAEYLGVSPQAVSKWEQELSVPDVYLIPKIALFFNISIDALFGNTELKTIELLVGRYRVHPNDKNYKEAKDAIKTLLDMQTKDTEGLKQLVKLENYRAHEFLQKGQEACQELLAVATSQKDVKRATIQLIRTKAMLGDVAFVEAYRAQFEVAKTAESLNYLLIALGNTYQYETMLKLGREYIDTFNEKEQLEIYPNLIEAAYALEDNDYVKAYFDFIIKHTNDVHQCFNAWWILWKTYRRIGDQEGVDKCKIELLAQLPKQGCNEYIFEQITSQLMNEDHELINVL